MDALDAATPDDGYYDIRDFLHEDSASIQGGGEDLHSVLKKSSHVSSNSQVFIQAPQI